MCSVSSAVGSRPGTVSAGIAAQQAIKNDKNSSTTKGVTQDNARNTDTISRTTAPANQTAETQTQAKSVVSNVAKEEVTDPSKSTKSGGMKDSYNASPQLQQQLAAGVQGSQSNTPAKVTADIVKGLQKDEGNKQKQGDEPIEGFTRSESMKNNKAKPDGVGRRRHRGENEEDDDNGQGRRRRPALMPLVPQKKALTIIEGARVGESQTQDMFVSSAVTQERITGKLNKTTIEQIKEYSETNTSDAIYNIVSANYNHKEKNGIGPNMQKDLFGEMLSHISKIDDVISPEYRRFVRDVIQGAMRAGYDSKLEMKDLVKMLVSGFMAMSPHDDEPQIMAEVIKYIVSEIMYGKINIGYNMKLASVWLGAASYTLVLYYKEYQNEIEFNRELEQTINIAFSENIWKATGEISNYSQVSAKVNVEQFMAGRMEEEKLHSKNYVKNMVLSPLKNVFKKVNY